MAKIIRYQLAHGENEGEVLLTDVAIKCPTEASLQANLPVAEREAYNGEYTIEDDGAEGETTKIQEE